MLKNYYANLEDRSCIICGSVSFLTLSTSMKKGPQLTTVICKQCSLVFTNPIPVQETYYSFYTDDYEKYYGKATATKPELSNVSPIFSILSKFIDIKSSHYLEIGPGRGGTLYHANKLFKRVIGVEPSIEFSNLLSNEYNLKVITNTFEGFVSDNNEEVDVVGMFHVFEHIYDPYKALVSIREVLRENGLVVIEVPNILKPFRNLDTYFLRYVHLFNFSPLTLKSLLIKCGFDILYENDGGSIWSTPQNITIIARKTNKAISNNFDQSEFLKVKDALSKYRIKYFFYIRFKWWFYRMKKITFRFLRGVKFSLVSLFK
jgi:SAM-dependent methyltransferase